MNQIERHHVRERARALAKRAAVAAGKRLTAQQSEAVDLLTDAVLLLCDISEAQDQEQAP